MTSRKKPFMIVCVYFAKRMLPTAVTMSKDFTVFNNVFAPFFMKTSKNCQENPDQEISQPRILLTVDRLS